MRESQGTEVRDLQVGDIVRLRKAHPCGASEWQVVRVGADIGLRCLGCGHRVLIARHAAEKRIITVQCAERVSVASPKVPG